MQPPKLGFEDEDEIDQRLLPADNTHDI